MRTGAAISFGWSCSIAAARRIANMPSFVSPNVTSTCGEMVASKSIQAIVRSFTRTPQQLGQDFSTAM